MSKGKDITSQKFGKLTAIKKVGLTEKQLQKWLCQCDCGNYKEVAYTHLVKGLVMSCGCLKANAAEKATKAINEASVDGVKIPLITKKRAKNNTTGRKGISKVKTKTGRIRYRVRITLNNKTIQIGNFDTLEEAIKARELAEEKYYKPYIDEYEERKKEEI